MKNMYDFTDNLLKSTIKAKSCHVENEREINVKI